MMALVTFDLPLLLGLDPTADCEAVHDGLLRQPVNTVSSLAFLAAGAWIVLRAARREPEERGASASFGAAMAIVGLGSLLLHGPDPSWGLWFHDLSGLAVLLLVAGLDVGLLLGWSVRSRLLAVGAGLVVLGLALAAIPSSTVPIAWVLAPAAGLSELMVLRARARSSVEPERSTRSWVVAASTLLLAAGAYLLGRSGSSLCNPQSVLQWHAVWHVLVAISAAAFASASFAGRSLTRGPRNVGPVR
jgi:predicted membrane channel-forming protein YqfA (hemolysin III family)